MIFEVTTFTLTHMLLRETPRRSLAYGVRRRHGAHALSQRLRPAGAAVPKDA
ncbi:MAG: hypothetical protein QOH59_2173 [Gemmatimonadales bacterium]|jgi:hypothetical protein|nr:hypothetical protein [Gemmatimonadales bacterium]